VSRETGTAPAAASAAGMRVAPGASAGGGPWKRDVEAPAGLIVAHQRRSASSRIDPLPRPVGGNRAAHDDGALPDDFGRDATSPSELTLQNQVTAPRLPCERPPTLLPTKSVPSGCRVSASG
jgi:hypothetical protein